jgi:hypothetical protein
MKKQRASNMHLVYRVKPSEVTTDNLTTFNQLVRLLRPYARRLEVRVNEKYLYQVWTEHEYRTTSFHPVRKRGILFAGVAVLKGSVGLYFYPICINEELLHNLDPCLQAIMETPGIFHIRKLTEPLEAGIIKLLDTGMEVCETNGWIHRNI